MLTIRTIDDRDRPIRLPLRRVRWPLGFWWKRRDLSWRGLRREIVWLARKPAVWLALGGIGLLITLVLLTLQDTAMGLGMLVISPVAAPILALALVTGRGLIGLGGDLPRIIRAALLQAERCPLCEYELGQLDCQPDGCITCPECGAAWNWDAIGNRGGRDPVVVVIDRKPDKPA